MHGDFLLLAQQHSTTAALQSDQISWSNMSAHIYSQLPRVSACLKTVVEEEHANRGNMYNAAQILASPTCRTSLLLLSNACEQQR